MATDQEIIDGLTTELAGDNATIRSIEEADSKEERDGVLAIVEARRIVQGQQRLASTGGSRRARIKFS